MNTAHGQPEPILPDVDEPVAAPFWAACARGELVVQACGTCGRRRMPPREMCPDCQSFEVDWHTVDGRGRVWSFVVAHPPLLPYYAERSPYVVAVIELADDPSIRLVGQVLDADPTRLQIGDEVRVDFAETGGVTLPHWRA
jgi:uncharacterized protein